MSRDSSRTWHWPACHLWSIAGAISGMGLGAALAQEFTLPTLALSAPIAMIGTALGSLVGRVFRIIGHAPKRYICP